MMVSHDYLEALLRVKGVAVLPIAYNTPQTNLCINNFHNRNHTQSFENHFITTINR